ncbi:rhodanese-related sulfurtransferase [Pontibacter ummariensis]|uniref:Rhodanese-related sulfurtransferase n=2 Tax=Pontibacter ummariensis TaxID=1610492 RepID=A0A239JRJ5_9BACT|nr:rhodanese-related sulfurtransferase [Pontibacter ummariensis]SNT08399.1 Rhodanese-related sulfurtransferase [Pontibacter ummariensis]
MCWLPLLQACSQPTNKAYALLLKSLYDNTVPQIKPEKLYQLLEQKHQLLLLDTRSTKEFAVSHMKGARQVDPATFQPTELGKEAKDKLVVVYCSVGYRSERVGEKLQQAGFTNVLNLYGGLFEWVNRGFPVYNRAGVTQQVHAYSELWGMWLQKGEKVYDE